MFKLDEAWVIQCAAAAKYALRLDRYRDSEGNSREFDGMTEHDDIVLIILEIEWDKQLARYARIREAAQADVIQFQRGYALRVA